VIIMTKNKIYILNDLKKNIEILKKNKKKIVHIHGTFDLLHIGHVKYFQEGKSKGDILVVTLTADNFIKKGPGKPIFSEDLRTEMVASIQCVDFVALVHEPSGLSAIEMIKPNIYLKGSDYKDALNDKTRNLYKEKLMVEKYGGIIEFANTPKYSSSKLSSDFRDLPIEVKSYLDNIKKRFSLNSIEGLFNEISKLKVLVIGEPIIDEYIFVKTKGRAIKDPIMSVEYIDKEIYFGGSIITARNVAGFVEFVTLYFPLGIKNKEYYNFIKSFRFEKNLKFNSFNVKCPTIVKKRFIDKIRNNKLFKEEIIDESYMYDYFSKNGLKLFEKIDFKKYDLVIVNDFGHGFISKSMAKYISNNSNFLALNVQTNSSNYGFNLVEKYPFADYLTINLTESKLAIRDKNLDIINTLQQFVTMYPHFKKILFTLGDQGCMFYNGNNYYSSPALISKTVDTIGAGDAILSISSLFLKSGIDDELLPLLSNCIGALAVNIMGNKNPISKRELLKYIMGAFV